MEKSKSEKILELFGQEQPLCLAPMYELNDLAFRTLCRKNGVKFCWSGMINAHLWVMNPRIRENYFQTCEKDRPLIIQITGNSEEELISTAIDVEPLCDAIDINLGCTKHIARRGNYGFYLVNTETKRQNVIKMVENLNRRINKPITAKIRLINDDDGNPCPQITSEFAKALETAGISLLSVHGRSNRQDKHGPVDSDAIKVIVQSVKIPVIANGGINNKDEGFQLMQNSGAFGIMIGQGLLKNPKMFSDDPNNKPLDHTREYIALFKEYPDNFYIARRHIFNFYEEHVRRDESLTAILKGTHSIEQLEKAVEEIEKKLNTE